MPDVAGILKAMRQQEAGRDDSSIHSYGSGAKMKEAELVKSIRVICDRLKLHAFHVGGYRIPGTTRSPGSSGGFPDWVIVGPGGIYFRECKSSDGRRSLAQIAWGRAIQAAGGDYAVWRPEDLTSGHVLSELQELAALRVASNRPARALADSSTGPISQHGQEHQRGALDGP
jgi:hypothetical protein